MDNKEYINQRLEEVLSKISNNISQNDIDDAIMEALKRKNCGIQFIDRTLYKKNHKQEKLSANSEIEDLFNQVYVKKRK